MNLFTRGFLLWYLFQIANAKNQMSLSDRVDFLKKKSLQNPVIPLNSELFRTLVHSVPRNYSLIVQLTALQPQRSCGVCQMANDDYKILANSWRHSPVYLTDKVFFASLDFDDAKDIFQEMELNTAPQYHHFPAMGVPRPRDIYKLQTLGVDAESMARWVAECTDVRITIFRPPNYMALLFLIVLMSLVVMTLYVTKNSFDFLYNSTTWGYGALGFVFTMISGQMWNHIRGPPLIAQYLIEPSSQRQLVLETYIILVLYALITVGMVLMTDAASKRNQSQAVLGLAFFAILFGLLLKIFREKAYGYPYMFLF